jgi:hypothetical protein
MLDFTPPLDSAEYEAWLETPDYLTVYLMPVACALDSEDTPFEPGPFGDVPTRTNEFGAVEVLAGETIVQLDTTFTSDQAAMVASIQPVDLDAVLALVAGAPPF